MPASLARDFDSFFKKVCQCEYTSTGTVVCVLMTELGFEVHHGLASSPSQTSLKSSFRSSMQKHRA